MNTFFFSNYFKLIILTLTMVVVWVLVSALSVQNLGRSDGEIALRYAYADVPSGGCCGGGGGGGDGSDGSGAGGEGGGGAGGGGGDPCSAGAGDDPGGGDDTGPG